MRSLTSAGAPTPGFEYTLARSAEARPESEGRPAGPAVVVNAVEQVVGSRSMFVESTERGRDSRELPQTEDGAMARTEAFVSRELRRRRFEEEASVRMDALSVSKLPAVAAAKVAGCRWLGTAEAGGLTGYWCEKVTGLCVVATGAGSMAEGADDCIVVSVVVSDSCDARGELKVLLARPLYMPSVYVVPAREKPVSE